MLSWEYLHIETFELREEKIRVQVFIIIIMGTTGCPFQDNETELSIKCL